jgi:ABC-type sugar transport system ATPase subunit
VKRLSITGVTKSFPGVRALDDVSLSVESGKVHAIVGENGAGKSTLVKILAGVHSPDAGTLQMDDSALTIQNPRDAIESGLVLIFQELSLVPELTAAENIFLGRLPKKRTGFVDQDEARRRATKILRQFECDFSAGNLVAALSHANQQMVEIGRALAQDTKVLMFDEPTASLSSQETEVLFRNIRRLRDSGTAIIYISHKLDEVFELADTVTVMRDGKLRATLPTAETSIDEVVSLMIGRDVNDYFEYQTKSPGDVVLTVEGLTQGTVFQDVSFSVRAGETLGFYGLVGAGRSELMRALFGYDKYDSGDIEIRGKERKIHNTRTAVRDGLGMVPENRKSEGIVPGMSVLHNCSLIKIRDLTRFGVISRKKEQRVFEKFRKGLSIRTTGPNQTINKLSGGNQQKTIIARWLSIAPDILILDEPTRGIDVGAKVEIYRLIDELAKQGMAVIVISSEMPEILGICDRVITMCEGRKTGEFTREQLSEEVLIRAISPLNATQARAGE